MLHVNSYAPGLQCRVYHELFSQDAKYHPQMRTPNVSTEDHIISHNEGDVIEGAHSSCIDLALYLQLKYGHQVALE